MMKLLHLAIIGAATIVSGCASPAQTQAADQTKCSQYGFAPNTDAFARCMMSTDMNRQNQNEAALRATNRRIDAEDAARSAAFQAKMNGDQP